MFPGDLQDHNLKRRGELEVSQAGARRHAEELRKNNVKPAARPVVGEIRKYIYDKWNPDLLIGISTWEREDVEKEYSKGLNKYYKRFAKYGCWGHPGKMAGHGRVSAHLFCSFLHLSWDAKSWHTFTPNIWVIPRHRKFIHIPLSVNV